eukprot:GHVH01008450.1.p1 GENE.GHVH01008450.1~~GHVH01008450.1.p1  ORF type:complete len:2747 (-),score=323.02 GHVH01008450.1:1346-9586(-)
MAQHNFTPPDGPFDPEWVNPLEMTQLPDFIKYNPCRGGLVVDMETGEINMKDLRLAKCMLDDIDDGPHKDYYFSNDCCHSDAHGSVSCESNPNAHAYEMSWYLNQPIPAQDKWIQAMSESAYIVNTNTVRTILTISPTDLVCNYDIWKRMLTQIYEYVETHSIVRAPVPHLPVIAGFLIRLLQHPELQANDMAKLLITLEYVLEQAATNSPSNYLHRSLVKGAHYNEYKFDDGIICARGACDGHRGNPQDQDPDSRTPLCDLWDLAVPISYLYSVFLSCFNSPTKYGLDSSISKQQTISDYMFTFLKYRMVLSNDPWLHEAVVRDLLKATDNLKRFNFYNKNAYPYLVAIVLSQRGEASLKSLESGFLLKTWTSSPNVTPGYWDGIHFKLLQRALWSGLCCGRPVHHHLLPFLSTFGYYMMRLLGIPAVKCTTTTFKRDRFPTSIKQVNSDEFGSDVTASVFSSCIVDGMMPRRVAVAKDATAEELESLPKQQRVSHYLWSMLSKMRDTLVPFVSASAQGSYTQTVAFFIASLTQAYMDRVILERSGSGCVRSSVGRYTRGPVLHTSTCREPVTVPFAYCMRLTEEDDLRFISIMFPMIQQGIWSKSTATASYYESAMRWIFALRPSLLIPSLCSSMIEGLSIVTDTNRVDFYQRQCCMYTHQILLRLPSAIAPVGQMILDDHCDIHDLTRSSSAVAFFAFLYSSIGICACDDDAFDAFINDEEQLNSILERIRAKFTAPDDRSDVQKEMLRRQTTCSESKIEDYLGVHSPADPSRRISSGNSDVPRRGYEDMIYKEVSFTDGEIERLSAATGAPIPSEVFGDFVIKDKKESKKHPKEIYINLIESTLPISEDFKLMATPEAIELSSLPMDEFLKLHNFKKVMWLRYKTWSDLNELAHMAFERMLKLLECLVTVDKWEEGTTSLERELTHRVLATIKILAMNSDEVNLKRLVSTYIAWVKRCPIEVMKIAAKPAGILTEAQPEIAGRMLWQSLVSPYAEEVKESLANSSKHTSDENIEEHANPYIRNLWSVKRKSKSGSARKLPITESFALHIATHVLRRGNTILFDLAAEVELIALDAVHDKEKSMFKLGVKVIRRMVEGLIIPYNDDTGMYSKKLVNKIKNESGEIGLSKLRLEGVAYWGISWSYWADRYPEQLNITYRLPTSDQIYLALMFLERLNALWFIHLKMCLAVSLPYDSTTVDDHVKRLMKLLLADFKARGMVAKTPEAMDLPPIHDYLKRMVTRGGFVSQGAFAHLAKRIEGATHFIDDVVDQTRILSIVPGLDRGESSQGDTKTVEECKINESRLVPLEGRWDVIHSGSELSSAPTIGQRHNHALRLMSKAMNILLKCCTNAEVMMSQEAKDNAQNLKRVLQQRTPWESDPIWPVGDRMWVNEMDGYPSLLAVFSLELTTSLTITNRKTGQWTRLEDRAMLNGGVPCEEPPWKEGRLKGPEEIRFITRWMILAWLLNEYSLPKIDYQMQGNLFSSMSNIRSIYSNTVGFLSEYLEWNEVPRRWWSENHGIILARSISGKSVEPFYGKYVILNEILLELAMSYESDVREMAVDILMIRTNYNYGDSSYFITKAIEQLLPQNLYHITGEPPLSATASRSIASSNGLSEAGSEAMASSIADRSSRMDIFQSGLPSSNDAVSNDGLSSIDDPTAQTSIPNILMGRTGTVEVEVSTASNSNHPVILSLADVSLKKNQEAAKDIQRKIIDCESSRIMGACEVLVVAGHIRRILCDPLLATILCSSLSFILRSKHAYSYTSDTVMYLASAIIKGRSTGFIQSNRRSKHTTKLSEHNLVRIHGLNLKDNPILFDIDLENATNNSDLFREAYIRKLIDYRKSKWTIAPESSYRNGVKFEALNQVSFRQTLFDQTILAVLYSPAPMPMPVSTRAAEFQNTFTYFSPLKFNDTDSSTRCNAGPYTGGEEYMRSLWRHHNIEGPVEVVEPKCMNAIRDMMDGIIGDVSCSPRSSLHSAITSASLSFMMYNYSTLDHCRSLCDRWGVWDSFMSMKILSQFIERTIIIFHDAYRAQNTASSKVTYPRSCYSMVSDLVKLDSIFSATVASKGSGQLIMQNLCNTNMLLIAYQVIEDSFPARFSNAWKEQVKTIVSQEDVVLPEPVKDFIYSGSCPGWVGICLVKLSQWVEKPKYEVDIQITFYEVVAALVRVVTFDKTEKLIYGTMKALKPLLDKQQKRISMDVHFAWESAIRWIVQAEHPRILCTHPWTGPGYSRDKNEEAISLCSKSCVRRFRIIFDAILLNLPTDHDGGILDEVLSDDPLIEGEEQDAIEEEDGTEEEGIEEEDGGEEEEEEVIVEDEDMEASDAVSPARTATSRPANTLIRNKRYSVIVNMLRENPLYMFKHMCTFLPHALASLDQPGKDIYSFCISYVLDLCLLLQTNIDTSGVHSEEMEHLFKCKTIILDFLKEQIPVICDKLDNDISVVAKVGDKPQHVRLTEGIQSFLGLVFWLQSVRHHQLDELQAYIFRFCFSCVRHPDKAIEIVGRRLLTYIGMSPSNFQLERANEFKDHDEIGTAHLRTGLLECLVIESRRGFHPSQPGYNLTVDAEQRSYKRRWAAVHLADILQGNFRIALTGTIDRGMMLSLMISHLMDPHHEVRSIAQAGLSNSICALNQEECIRLRNAFLYIAGEPFTCDKREINQVRAGVWGIKSMVEAFPATLPRWMPKTIVSLSEYGNSRAPDSIKRIVQDTLQNFMATHQDGWNQIYKRQFTRNQLESITTYKGIPVYFS